MRNMFKGSIAALALCASAALFAPAPAHAQMAVQCVNCSNSIQQLLGYAKQLQQMETQLQQYSTQLQQYANMVQNTAANPQQIYSSAMSDMQQVQNIMNSGSQLSFTNPGTTMGTFSSFLSSTSGQLGNLTAQAQQYQTWSQQQKDGITSAMNALSMQNSQLTSDQNTVSQLKVQAASAQGQMQAIQNGAELTAQQVAETEKLRQLIMVQTQLAANQQSVASQQQSSDEAQWQNFVGTTVQPTSGATYK